MTLEKAHSSKGTKILKYIYTTIYTNREYMLQNKNEIKRLLEQVYTTHRAQEEGSTT